MKKTKLACNFFLTMAVALAMVIPTVATGESNSITINSLDTEAHTYDVYQIFTGSYSDGKMSDIDWGDGVSGEGLLSMLATSPEFEGMFETCVTAADMAEVLAGQASSGVIINFLANNMGSYLETSCGTIAIEKGSTSGTITGLDDGYYFIQETTRNVLRPNRSKHMVQVVGSVAVSVTAKVEVPSVGKTVQDSDHWTDTATASMGNSVSLRLVGLVPNMSNYTTYAYQFNDTLPAGLTFNNDVRVYLVEGDSLEGVMADAAIGRSNLVAERLYVVDTAAANSACTFTVRFENLKDIGDEAAGSYIIVEYTAALNAQANLEGTGNTSEVTLTYPSGANDATPEETPGAEVAVFTFDLPINKVSDEQDENSEYKELIGATFALFAEEEAAKVAAKTPDGTGVFDRAFLFTGGAGAYQVYDGQDQEGTAVSAIASNRQGKYTVAGLGAGTYYLVEVDSPDGYNRLTVPVKIELEARYTYGENSTIIDSDGGVYVDGSTEEKTAVEVINKVGTVLPATGGASTALLTVCGIALMVGTAVLITTKRRMSAKKI